MRPIDPEDLAIVGTSRSGDHISANIWRGGVLLAQGIPLGDWSLSHDGTRQVHGSGAFRVVDSTGQLSPWVLEDPLGVGGSRLQIVYHVGGGGEVNLGWYRITGATADESWRTYDVGQTGRVWASAGSSIMVHVDDLTVELAYDEFLAPESPVSGNTVLDEVERLLDGILPFDVHEDVVDGPVGAGVVYSTTRLAAVDDLLTSIGATHRMDADGVLEILPVYTAESVWEVRGGEGGALVRLQRTQALSGLRNAFAVRGHASDGTPVQGVAALTEGPLRYGGPAGRLGSVVQDGLVTTNQQAQARAAALLAAQMSSLSQPAEVTCLPNPSLQEGDLVQIECPVSGGGSVMVAAQVVKTTLRCSNGVVVPMTVTAAVSYADLALISGRSP